MKFGQKDSPAILDKTGKVKTPAKTEVKDLQKSLIALGFPLPKYRADGDLGGETLGAMSDFALKNGMDLGVDEALNTEDELDDVVEAILGAVKAVTKGRTDAYPALDFRAEGHKGVHRHGIRPIQQIDSIVLHQTAYIYTYEKAWDSLRAHILVPRPSEKRPDKAVFAVINHIEQYMWHANSLNKRSIGIEIEGNMYGLEGKQNTFWEPPLSVPEERRGPHELGAVQLEGAREAVRYCVEQAKERGGEIKYIFAHRQSSKDRVGDPGEAIWREVGLWAMKEFGLSDGGPKAQFGSGRALPDGWTGEKRGVKYI